MKIKTGDNVKILSGKDKGKTGKVVQVFKKNLSEGTAKIVIEGTNVLKKHLRPRQRGEKGQVLELSAPMNASNVMLIDGKSGKPTRIGFQMEGKDKKRIAKKSREFID